jgi:hypothetical protein
MTRPTLVALFALLLAGGASAQGIPSLPQIPGLPTLGGGSSQPPAGTAQRGQGLSTGEIGGGLKDALRVGTERAVGRLGRDGGYFNDKDARIPLPGPFGQVSGALKAAGMGGALDDLELRMNRAAEKAAPQAGRIFGDAIQRMSFQDAQAILRGPNDAATRYFRRETTDPLRQAMRPVVDKELQGAGATQAFQQVAKQAAALPLVGQALGGGGDLTGWVLDKALAGLFLHLGREEAAIRQNPAQRSTDLLKKVFN